MRTCQQISPQTSKMLEFWKTLIKRIKPHLKKTPSRLVSFLVKLLNDLFCSCLWKNSDTRCFLLLSFFFFIQNITTICKNKIPPSSEPEMISKELENSHLSSFSVNLTDIFKIIAIYRRKVISKISSKIVIYLLVEIQNHVHNTLRLLMSHQISFPLNFPM